jgi:hypothetical protein
MRCTVILLAFGLLAGACASAAPDTPTTGAVLETGSTQSTSPAPTISAPPPSTPDTASGTTVAPQKPPPEGPEAPDFTTALASGEPYTLSEAVKPVYLIFWAEW